MNSKLQISDFFPPINMSKNLKATNSQYSWPLSTDLLHSDSKYQVKKWQSKKSAVWNSSGNKTGSVDLFSGWTRELVKHSLIKHGFQDWLSSGWSITGNYSDLLNILVTFTGHYVKQQNSGLDHWPTTVGEQEFLHNLSFKGSKNCLQGACRHIFGVQDEVKLLILQATKVVVIKTGFGLLFLCLFFK